MKEEAYAVLFMLLVVGLLLVGVLCVGAELIEEYKKRAQRRRGK